MRSRADGCKVNEETRALGGLRVLAIEQYAAGPFATAQLVDLGADVIKIEDPESGGDTGRLVPPYATGDASLFFETFNRGKRSVTIDLASAGGRRVFEMLVSRSDAVFANVRGDIPKKLGLRYADLCRINPRIVCCFLTAYGLGGQRCTEPGYDYLMQGQAGWMLLNGEPGCPPEKTGLSLVDFTTGFAATGALLAGVEAAHRTGRGRDCEVALYDVALSLLTYLGTWHLTAGYLPTRTAQSAHPSLVPFQNFRTSDGWIVVACAKQKFWAYLADAVGKPEWAEDPDYQDFDARRKNAEPLLEDLAAIFREATTADWLVRLTRYGVPCGPVNDIKQALSDPEVAARGLVVETEHPRLGNVRQLAGPLRVGSFDPVRTRAPFLGEHTSEVLEMVLDLDGDAIEQLVAEGAFGRPEAVVRPGHATRAAG